MEKMLLLGLAVLLVNSMLMGCGESNPSPAKQGPTPNEAQPGTIKTNSGLQYIDIKVGTGAVTVSGKNVAVHYTGWLTNGTKFDSSVDRGQPFQFTLGMGQVIRGWDEGVSGMKVGGKRKLTIPPNLGYGESNMGVIPPNSTLIFEVELLGVQ